MPQAVYIHIPFCQRICPYCDFTKFISKGQPVMDYLISLRKEMETMVSLYPPKRIKSIFIGGGTPTILTNEQMDFLFHSIRDIFPLDEEVEFTIEANPETIDRKKLETMKRGGVNRLSFGVQTFDPHLLKKLGRGHTSHQVTSCIEWAKEMGFTNISIDLMFGLPEQSLASLKETLDEAFKLHVTHVSTYSLQIEEGTFFYRLYQQDKLPLPPEEMEAEMFELIMNEMESHGYKHYEISNFALPGYESQHNLTYWRNEEYYGLGVGAHGYVQRVRYANHTSLKKYMEQVTREGLAQKESHPVSEREEMENMLIMGLRTMEGVSKERFEARFGISLEKVYGGVIEKLHRSGLLATDGKHYFLTKKGIYLGNEVFAHFLLD